MLIGLALYNQTVLKLDFPLVLYKKLLHYRNKGKSEDFVLEDIQEIEPDIYNTLRNIRDNQCNEDLGISFVINYESWGESLEHELIPNGAQILVTENNKGIFINKYIDWILNESIQKQFEPFAKGFLLVSQGKMIDMFNEQELQYAICGVSNLDFEQLRKTTVYDDGYDEES